MYKAVTAKLQTLTGFLVSSEEAVLAMETSKWAPIIGWWTVLVLLSTNEEIVREGGEGVEVDIRGCVRQGQLQPHGIYEVFGPF